MLATEVNNSSPSTSGGAAGNVWKSIWKIRTLQKIKHFIWRAVNDSLSTKQNLARRQIPVDETCSLCEANFDVALFEHYNSAGLGVVVRDCTGAMIGALSQRILLPQSVEHSEALAASRAVSLAELCLFPMIFEGDCLRIITAINLTEACHTLFGHIIDEIRCLSSSLVSSYFVLTHREGNNLAHALVRRVVLTADTDGWVEELPNDLKDVFHSKLIQ